MSDAQSRNSQDLMQALESLRHLLEKDETDISQSVDLNAIPTLNRSVAVNNSPLSEAAPLPTEKHAELDAAPSPIDPTPQEQDEVQLSFSELEEDDVDQEFQALWKILKPKLKKAVRESYQELKASHKR